MLRLVKSGLAAFVFCALAACEGTMPPDDQTVQMGTAKSEAIIGLWQNRDPVDARFFGPKARITTQILRFREGGDYFSGLEIEVEAAEGSAAFRIITRGRWKRIDDRVLIDDANTQLDLIDYRSDTVSDAVIYASVERWRNDLEEYPLNETISIHKTEANALFVHDGENIVRFQRAS